MATYIDNIVKFHTFSKSPVSKDTTLGGAVNPSGHTVTTTQVRAQNIPAFLNTFQGTKEQAITWLGTNYPTPAHNDIVFYGGEFKAGFSTPKCLKWNAKLETPAWEDFDITTAATLKNADDKDVIAVHQNCTTVFVDGSNNAATNSNRNSLFVKRADGSILDHFVAATDKIVAGMPSLGYNALVLWNGGAIDEGELEANYIGNTFAGIVHLNKQYSTGDDAKFKVTCFEYIGEKLDTALGNIDGKIQDIVDTTMEGVVASVGTTDAATNAGISVDSTTKTSPKINITTGTVGGDSDAKLVTGSTVKTYVDSATSKATVSAEGVITTGDEDKLVTATGAQNIAGKVVSDATLTTPDGSSDAIKDATDTSKLVTAEQVKTYVTNNAQVTVKVGETEQATTNLELVGSAGDDVTITTTADTADGYKVTFDATIDKAIVTDGVIDTTTGNGDKVISATAAKSVAEKAIETALADTSDGSLGKKINDVQEIAEAKVADVTVDNSSIVDDNKVAKLTTTGTDAIAADGESTSTKLATEASVAKTAQNLTTAIDAIAGVGVSYEVLADNEKHESVTAPVKGRIYLEKDETAADGTYIEWFYTGTDWEKIGSTKADHSGYAKTITINKETKTVSDNAVDLGKAASSVTAGNGVTSGTVSDTGALSLTLDVASTDKKGIVQLASEHDSEDTANAATGATVASAISGIASTSQSNKGVTVTTAGGSVTGVEVTTTPLVVEDTLVESVTDDNLITAADTLAAIKLAKPENYVASVTGYTAKAEEVTTTQGAAIKIFDNRGPYVTAKDLWGTTARITTNGGSINIFHDWVTAPYDGIKDKYLITKVENNKAYEGEAGDTFFANIQTERIKDGSAMFVNCNNLKSFSSELPNLINGERMFNFCTELESFTADLSSLTNGYYMFGGTKLTTFSSDLSSLTNGYYMFYKCDKLTSFSSDLSSLTNGTNMFNSCTQLTSFCGDLSSLTDGTNMFNDCKLDTESVEIIADTINDVTGLEISDEITKRIGISISNTTPNDEEDAAFKQMQDKGWDVFVNGSETVYVPRTGEVSLNETGETAVAPKPYWAKPIEVTEDKAEYVGQDGKFYQVAGGQFIYVNDPETYGMFVSLEDAIANMRLTKYEKPVEEA